MAATQPKLGLRERKKLRTRETIVAVATRLFVEHGYEATTTAQIAEAAEVSPSTFFKYFPTKADVVFSLFDAIIESAEQRVLVRPTGEPATDALVAWIAGELPGVAAPRRVPADRQGRRAAADHRGDAHLRPRVADRRARP